MRKLFFFLCTGLPMGALAAPVLVSLDSHDQPWGVNRELERIDCSADRGVLVVAAQAKTAAAFKLDLRLADALARLENDESLSLTVEASSASTLEYRDENHTRWGLGPALAPYPSCEIRLTRPGLEAMVEIRVKCRNLKVQGEARAGLFHFEVRNEPIRCAWGNLVGRL